MTGSPSSSGKGVTRARVTFEGYEAVVTCGIERPRLDRAVEHDARRARSQRDASSGTAINRLFAR